MSLDFHQITPAQCGCGGFFQGGADRCLDGGEVGAFHQRRVADNDAHVRLIFEYGFDAQRGAHEIDQHQDAVAAGDLPQTPTNSIGADSQRSVYRAADCDNRHLPAGYLFGKLFHAAGETFAVSNDQQTNHNLRHETIRFSEDFDGMARRNAGAVADLPAARLRVAQRHRGT